MAFVSYITYEEYTILGGTVSQDAFTNLERKAQRILDYLTFDRIPLLDTIPEVVKEVLTEYIDKLNSLTTEENKQEILTYSNEVETISYSPKSDNTLKKEFNDLATSMLPNYLVNRSVTFNAEEYIQSNINNS